MPDRSRFVLAHGFTQTSRSWEEVEQLLTAALPGTSTVAVDLPGHGAAADRRGDLWDAAAHLVGEGGRGIYVGYSLGGRVALHAAVAHPRSLAGLVLISATAGIDDPTERAERRRADDRLAARIERIGLAAFIDEWLDQPLFAGLDEVSCRREDRLRNTTAGLAASLRSAGTGTQEPLWDRLRDVHAPTLVLAGQHDAKFRALGERLAATLPRATYRVVPGAGHSAHLEEPEATVEDIVSWLQRA